MKNFLILLTFVLISTFVKGQNSNNFKNYIGLGINGAFYGYGDVYLPSTTFEYSRTLSNYLALTPMISEAYSISDKQGLLKYYSSFTASISLQLTPFPRFLHQFKFSVGGLYHKFKSAYYYMNYYDQPATFYGPGSMNNNLLGLIGSMRFDLIETRRIKGGFRFISLTSYNAGHINFDSWQAGLYVGLKF